MENIAIVMIWWAGKFRTKLKELKIVNELLKIYVDDVNGIFRPVNVGLEYKNGELRFNEEKAEKEKDLPEDERTMNVIRDIANSIDNMIRMTIDIPSKHEDDKVPMLDLKVWIEDTINFMKNQ